MITAFFLGILGGMFLLGTYQKSRQALRALVRGLIWGGRFS